MENFIIVLIAIGGLIYNVYKNYQKEMEKSKSRRPNVSPQSIPPIAPYETIDRSKQKNAQKVNTHEKTYEEELPEEVIAAQQRRRQSQVKNPIPALRIQEQHEDKNGINFDLRQAVIQAAILDRPYK
ncbi:hypothetical protein [Sphingobacterium composti Ten et al. 2007 non Yoo et al. 2007]|uniref:hypothetical protein n=1 Tax=Sphingobacterium composti TaxID=363260 RepID=UPI001356A8B2|nr:hypothetical protein [Sphingobacterium composti Ten et al. 2007 non Yoo et al. 2007]